MGATVTATPELEAGRVRLQVDGAPPGDALLLLRRDGLGVGVVRDTSEASVLPAETVTRRNRVTNPYPGSPATTTGWAASYAPGGAGAITNISGAGGPIGGLAWRATWTTASTASNAYLLQGSTTESSYEIPVTAGEAVVGSIYARTNKARTLHARIYWLDAAGNSAGGSTGGTPVAVAANTWARLTVPVNAVPAGAVRARLGVQSATGEAIWAVGDTLDVQGAQLEDGTVATPWFWGQFAASGAGASRRYFRWAGAQYASASEEYATSAVVYDYEPRQGEGTDYIAADADGVALATAPRLTIPAWGTWVKSPGRPYLNARCHLALEAGIRRRARRVVVDVEGSDLPVVLHEPRMGAQGGVQLLGLSEAMNEGIRRVLEDGAVVMLDTAPGWRVPYRYVSVGDTTEERPVGDGVLALDREARVHTLADVVEVPMPLGTSVVDQSKTYEQLPTLFGSYAAMAATVPTYEQLAI